MGWGWRQERQRHDFYRDRAVGMARRDPRRRDGNRLVGALVLRDALTGVGDVQLHDQQVVDVVEARGAHAGELAQLELEVVDRPDGFDAGDRRHRFACFAS